MRFARSRALQTIALGLAAVTASTAAVEDGSSTGSVPACARSLSSPVAERAIRSALVSRRDVLGDQLIGRPDGPSLVAVRRLLPALLFARGGEGREVTASGVYYLAFGMPRSLYGEKAFALHVADGSQIVTRRVDGRSLTVWVGGSGAERYGSCVRRLGPARLANGYLPILQTTYVDAQGTRYRQESFASRLPGVRSLVSILRLSVDATAARSDTIVRLQPSQTDLRAADDTLISGGEASLVFSRGGTFEHSEVGYRIPPHGRRVITAVIIHQPSRAVSLVADTATYDAARSELVRYWAQQSTPLASYEVPERAVHNAESNLLIQQVLHTWRYSIGNPYEELSFAEALDAAKVMASYGSPDVARAIIRYALEQLPLRYSNWRA